MNGNNFRYFKCEYSIRLVRNDWRIKAVWCLTLFNLRFCGETTEVRYSQHAIALAYKDMDEKIESIEGRWSVEEERKLGVDVIRENVKKKSRIFDCRQIEIAL